jgi:AcrR family transcriptional regulator
VSTGEAGALPRRRLPRAEREQLMLDAAEREFGMLGFAATSMDDIARGSGITKALIYEYFGSKDGIYDACMERVRGRLFDSIEDSLSRLPAHQRLHTFLDAYLRFLDEHRGQRWLLYSEISAGSANSLRLLNAEAVARMLRDGLPVTLPEIDLEVLAHAMVGAGEQVGRWWLDRPDHPREDAVARLEAITTAMIAEALARSAGQAR